MLHNILFNRYGVSSIALTKLLCYPNACQISERQENPEAKYVVFEPSWYLTIMRCVVAMVLSMRLDVSCRADKTGVGYRILINNDT